MGVEVWREGVAGGINIEQKKICDIEEQRGMCERKTIEERSCVRNPAALPDSRKSENFAHPMSSFHFIHHFISQLLMLHVGKDGGVGTTARDIRVSKNGATHMYEHKTIEDKKLLQTPIGSSATKKKPGFYAPLVIISAVSCAAS